MKFLLKDQNTSIGDRKLPSSEPTLMVSNMKCEKRTFFELYVVHVKLGVLKAEPFLNVVVFMNTFQMSSFKLTKCHNDKNKNRFSVKNIIFCVVGKPMDTCGSRPFLGTKEGMRKNVESSNVCGSIISLLAE